MYRFSARVTNPPNAGISFMMRYGVKYPDVVSLGQGTPLFPTPAFIYDELHARAQSDPLIGMYADTKPNILATLKEAIARQMHKDYGFTPPPERLAVTVGGAGALFAAILSLLNPGDEVIYFDPSYPLHLSHIHVAQARAIFVPLSEAHGWAIDLPKLEASITPRTKLIILTNPNNPTGTVLSEEEVRKLSDIVIRNDLILILDEAYYFLSYGVPVYSPLCIPELRDRIVVCRSFSKEYAMTGWRIGYAYAHPEIIEKIFAMQIYMSVAPPTPSMVAATIALTDPRGEEAMEGFRKKFTESRTAICQRLDRLPKLFSYHPPDGAYYIFARYHGFEMNAMDFAKFLVDEARVITIPGGGMGPSGEGHVRMSFAADATLIHQAFDKLDAFAKKHGLD